MKTIEKLVTKDKEQYTVESILPKYDLFKFGLGNFIYFDINSLFGSPDYYSTEYEEVDDVWNSEYTEYPYLDLITYETDDSHCVKQLTPMFFNSEIVRALANLVNQNSSIPNKKPKIASIVKNFLDKANKLDSITSEAKQIIDKEQKEFIKDDIKCDNNVNCKGEIKNNLPRNKSENLCKINANNDYLHNGDLNVPHSYNAGQSKNLFTCKFKNSLNNGCIEKKITEDDIVLWSSKNLEKKMQNDEKDVKNNVNTRLKCADNNLIETVKNKCILNNSDWHNLKLLESRMGSKFLDAYRTRKLDEFVLGNKHDIIEKYFNIISTIPKPVVSNTIDYHTLHFKQVLIYFLKTKYDCLLIKYIAYIFLVTCSAKPRTNQFKCRLFR